MRSRSWRWLAVRMAGLLEAPPAFISYGDGQITSIPRTRIGFALNPPNFKTG